MERGVSIRIHIRSQRLSLFSDASIMNKPKMKWVPEVVHVDGDKYPWKGYAVKGSKRELIASFCETLWPHSHMLSSLKATGATPRQMEMVIDGFYKVSSIKRKPYSGKKEAFREAAEYCALANNH